MAAPSGVSGHLMPKDAPSAFEIASQVYPSTLLFDSSFGIGCRYIVKQFSGSRNDAYLGGCLEGNTKGDL
jgi:hypothetical protein